LKVSRRFGGAYRLHLQGRSISRARNQGERKWREELCLAVLVTCLPPAFTLVSCSAYSSTLKMEADMFLRNVGWLSTDYTALYPVTSAVRTSNPHFLLVFELLNGCSPSGLARYPLSEPTITRTKHMVCLAHRFFATSTVNISWRRVDEVLLHLTKGRQTSQLSDSNLGQENDYSDSGVLWFFSAPPSKYCVGTAGRRNRSNSFRYPQDRWLTRPVRGTQENKICLWPESNPGLVWQSTGIIFVL
jgi:hypothetical protein